MITRNPTTHPAPLPRSVFDMSWTSRPSWAGVFGLLRAVCVGGVVVMVALAWLATHSWR